MNEKMRMTCTSNANMSFFRRMYFRMAQRRAGRTQDQVFRLPIQPLDRNVVTGTHHRTQRVKDYNLAPGVIKGLLVAADAKNRSNEKVDFSRTPAD